MQQRREQCRTGFTLIELLVVIGIIAVLSGLIYYVSYALVRSDRAQRGGAMVQSTLMIAKQVALRDRVVYGVRLVPDGTGNFNGLEYVFQPPDYVQNRFQVVGVMPNHIQFESDITDGLGTDKGLWPVRVDDVIQLQNSAQPRLIVRVGPDQTAGKPNLPANAIETASPNNQVLPYFSRDFRVMRNPRPVPGEEVIKLPDGVIIDAARSQLQIFIDALNPYTSVDYMFSPAQGIAGWSGLSAKIILWIRDTDADPATSKEQVLVVIYPKTGAIASYPVDTTSGDPYSFTRDHRPNGL